MWPRMLSVVVLAALAIFSRSSLMTFLHALSPSSAGPEAIHTAMGGRVGVAILEVMELGAHRDAGYHRALAGAHGDRSAPPVDHANRWHDQPYTGPGCTVGI